MILLTLLACGALQTPDPPRRAVLLVLDTVRADRLHLYGHDRPTSPHLDTLAQSATTWTQAFSAASWTLPSHASLFTGLSVHEHGVHKYRYVDDEGVLRMTRPMAPDGLYTLAEHLDAHGFTTAAFAANDGYLDARWNLDQGFDHYEVERTAGTTLVDRALAYLDDHAREDAFVFVNVMEAHTPYACDVPTQVGNTCAWPHDKKRYKKLALKTLAGKAESQTLARLSEDYDGGVAAADLAVGHLVEQLRTRGWLDDTLLVVTSDHGELFGAHDLLGHGKDLWNPLIRVPLVVKKPGDSAAATDDTTISGTHVAHLVLDGLGVPTEPFDTHWPPGEALAQAYYANAREIRVHGHTFLDRIRQAVITHDRKLLADDDGRTALYEALDMRETTPLTEDTTDLRTRLPPFDQGEPLPEPDDDPAATDKLRALGYVE